MRELALKKLQAAKEKANQDDVQIIEGSDERDNSNGSSSTTTLDRMNDRSSTTATTPVVSMDLTVDVVDIPVPMASAPSTVPTVSCENSLWKNIFVKLTLFSKVTIM